MHTEISIPSQPIPSHPIYRSQTFLPLYMRDGKFKNYDIAIPTLLSSEVSATYSKPPAISSAEPAATGSAELLAELVAHLIGGGLSAQRSGFKS